MLNACGWFVEEEKLFSSSAGATRAIYSARLHLQHLGRRFLPHRTPCDHPTAHTLPLSVVSSYQPVFPSPPTATLEAASARMAARDRFGVYAEPGLSPLQRAIREQTASLVCGINKE